MINHDDLEIYTYTDTGLCTGWNVNKEINVVIIHKPTGVRVRCEKYDSVHRNKHEAMQMLEHKLTEGNKMKITVERIKSNDDATLSVISIDGKFQCFGLEDEYRDEKIAHETRIPAGTYDLIARRHGGFYQRYSERYGPDHAMLEVTGVPGFTDILIHIGNTEGDTSGCLLVGEGCTGGDDLMVTNSARAYIDLYTKVMGADARSLVTPSLIEFIDLDRPKQPSGFLQRNG